MTEKRKKFLEVFLKALGAESIRWTNQNDNSISGTIIYDSRDTDEQRDFIWHMSEGNVPGDDVLNLLAYLIDKKLLDVDKIKVPVANIEIPDYATSEKERLFRELFKVNVNMVDEGQGTDYYFIHD